MQANIFENYYVQIATPEFDSCFLKIYLIKLTNYKPFDLFFVKF